MEPRPHWWEVFTSDSLLAICTHSEITGLKFNHVQSSAPNLDHSPFLLTPSEIVFVNGLLQVILSLVVTGDLTEECFSFYWLSQLNRVHVWWRGSALLCLPLIFMQQQVRVSTLLIRNWEAAGRGALVSGCCVCDELIIVFSSNCC